MSDRMNEQIGAYVGAKGPDLPDGTDKFLSTQQPDVTPVDDLSRFVTARIIELELEPRGEIDVFKNPEQAMAYRYAKHVREDCRTFRRITLRYVEARQALDAAEHPAARSALGLFHGGISEAMREIAYRWSDHHEFSDEWRLA